MELFKSQTARKEEKKEEDKGGRGDGGIGLHRETTCNAYKIKKIQKGNFSIKKGTFSISRVAKWLQQEEW